MSSVLFVPHDHVVFSQLDENEGVLVDLNAKRYYTLNETAIFVWRLLEKRLPATDIVNQLTDDYEVTTEQATTSVNNLLGELARRNLVTSA
ncbi:MAG: PqqD family protein [Pyrinomonadaceae bacterium]